MLTDVQIRTKIKNLVSSGLSELYTGEPVPIVPRLHSHWILSLDIGNAASMLRATSGKYNGKVYCYMIGSDSIQRERRDLKDGFNTGSMQKLGPNQRTMTRHYKIWAVHQLDTGTESDNSENRLIREVDFLGDYFDKKPTLDFTENEFRGHYGLQAELIDSFSFGDVEVHLAQMSLAVVLYRQLV